MLGLLFDLIFGKRKYENTEIYADFLARIAHPRVFRDAPFIESFFPYQNKQVKDMLWALKYDNHKHVAELFGAVIAENLDARVEEAALFKKQNNLVIIPIPLSSKRLYERGYNQSELLAKSIVKHSLQNLQLTTNVLKRKHTKRQAHTNSKQERKQNARNTFYVRNKHLIKDRDILLIDDIVTTGATLTEARRKLKTSGARSVRAIVVAH